jgi:two-component system, cell cycle response regulator DivK
MPAKILLVENDWASRELVCYLLQMHSYQVLTASRAEQAIALLHNEQPDLILSDLQLGRAMNGYHFGEWCQTQSALRGVPILCYTATWDLYDPDRAHQAGFIALIPKPIIPETFVRQVEFYLPEQKRGIPPKPYEADER